MIMMSKPNKYVLVSIPVILLLLAIAIPNFVKSRSVISMNACANNLRQIEAVKKQWALENQKTNNAVPTEKDLLPYIGPRNQVLDFPTCPSKGFYTIGRIGESVKCSIGGEGHTLQTD
jgi:hypothetical protein